TFKIGELSDAVATSFIIQKNLGCFGDGGAIVTNNEQVNKVTRLLRAHGSPARNADEAALYVALHQLFPGVPLRPDADFFDDLGGHSLLAARLVSVLRLQGAYDGLSVRDVYRARSLESLAAVMTSLRQQDHPTVALPRTPISRRRHFLCGLAQALVVPLLVLLHISEWLAPFLTYHLFTGDENDSILVAALLAVGVFLAAQITLFGIALAGKWLLVGRVKPGRFPLWGVTYFRWWLADMLRGLPPLQMLSGTPLLRWYLRAMGARIGPDVYIDALDVRVPDLLTIEVGASIGMGVHFENARVERGQLVIGSIHLGPQAVVDSYAILENDTALAAGSRLGGLSALASGQRIPPGEIWEGAPARRVDREVESLPPRPVVKPWVRWTQVVYFALAGLAVSALFFMLLFPTFMAIDWMDMHLWNLTENNVPPIVAFAIYFMLAIPSTIFLVLASILLTAALRWLLLSRQTAGIWSIYSLAYCRKWLLSQVLEGSLDVLHGLYASVFAPAWLRLMGAKVGRDTEVSTSSGIVPDLLTLGDHSFIADGVLLGDEEQRQGWMVLRPTTVGNRSFVGNGAYVPDGANIPDDILIGVQTRTPDNHQMAPGQTWLGSPPLLLPARECLAGFADRLTFHPSPWRRLGRAAIETLRIVLPMAFVIALGYVIMQQVLPLAEEEKWGTLNCALGAFSCLFGLASFLLVLALKWLLIGRYRPRSAPMWTPFVWLSEAVTNLYESLAVPNLLVFLRGTPFLPWALRLLGAKIGQRVYMDTTDLTEFDCVRIGDESELNGWCGPQTHLFEDRIMKIGLVEIGAQANIGSCSTILYDTHVGDRVTLGPLTLVAKGERLPPDTRWEGTPAASVQKR
ncbi:MAG: Pls/PosA family non-ribosomal peptide synthetase, partial [Phycisphaerae bacterium]